MSISGNDIVQNDENLLLSSPDLNVNNPLLSTEVIQTEQSVSINDDISLLLQEQQKTNYWLTALVFITFFAWAHGHLKNAVREVFKSGKSS